MTLKDGIDLRKLVGGEGVSFEIDSSQPPSTGARWSDQPYKNEELFEQLKGECALQGGESDGDSDDELVCVCVCVRCYDTVIL